MSMSTTFNMQKISSSDNNFRFDLIGSIDAHADNVLQSLTNLPSGAYVLLDFSQVERVNSMGLSLLLKVFEEWERKKIRIEVQQLDRMVSMLFKITGLGRFIKSDGKTADTTADSNSSNPQPPRRSSASTTETVAPATVSDKLNFVASLQSGQQLTGWYLLNTYLQRRMKKAIHFEQTADKPNTMTTDLFFARPFEACMMMSEYNFIPIIRPTNDADEVVILTRADDTRELKDYQNANAGTATENSFVYLLGRFLCDENGLDSKNMNFDFAGNEIKALQSLIRKKYDLVFMLKKTFDGLSSFSRNNVRKLDESQTDFACHLLCIKPQLKNEAEAIGNIFMEMANDDQGKQILQDIQVDSWIKPEAGELNMLQMVYNRYAL